jgi:ribosome biogenesis protein BRX1
MASLFTAQKAHTAKLDAKGKGKRKADDIDVDGDDVQQPKQKRNKQRVLLLSSRGITHRMRHLMNDLETLLPHVKKGNVMLLWTELLVLNEICLRFQT